MNMNLLVRHRSLFLSSWHILFASYIRKNTQRHQEAFLFEFLCVGLLWLWPLKFVKKNTCHKMIFVGTTLAWPSVLFLTCDYEYIWCGYQLCWDEISRSMWQSWVPSEAFSILCWLCPTTAELFFFFLCLGSLFNCNFYHWVLLDYKGFAQQTLQLKEVHKRMNSQTSGLHSEGLIHVINSLDLISI